MCVRSILIKTANKIIIMHAQCILSHPRVAAAVWWVRKVKSCDAIASTASAQVSYIGHLEIMHACLNEYARSHDGQMQSILRLDFKTNKHEACCQSTYQTLIQ